MALNDTLNNSTLTDKMPVFASFPSSLNAYFQALLDIVNCSYHAKRS
jgi:hypothetical protein